MPQRSHIPATTVLLIDYNDTDRSNPGIMWRRGYIGDGAFLAWAVFLYLYLIDNLHIVDDPLWEGVRQRQQKVHETSAAIRTVLHANARTGRGPKYVFSGLLACAQCERKFIIVDPLHYACGGWKYRGLSVCENTIKVSRAVVESVLLDAIGDDLFTAEGQAAFIQETTKLMTAHRRTQKPDHRQATKRLQEVEHAIGNIMAAITSGIVTPSTKTALEQAEAERDALVRSMQPQHKQVAKVAAFLPNAIGRFKALLDDLEHVTQRQVDMARPQLRMLLGKDIVLHPCADGEGRYLTAEVTGDYHGLLRLATGQNKSGGGQGIQPSLVPLLRFEIQGVALAA